MWKKYVAVAPLVFFVNFIVMSNPFVMVGLGESGIKIKLCEVYPAVWEGLHMIFLFIQTLKTVDIKSQKCTFKTFVYTQDKYKQVISRGWA